MLAAENRLRSTRDFQRVYRRGRSWGHPLVVLHVLPQPGGARWGISASKKVGNAVVRNRARRQVREVLRQALPGWREGHDGVVVIRAGATQAEFTEVRDAILELARRARLLTEPSDPQPALYSLPSARRQATEKTEDQRGGR